MPLLSGKSYTFLFACLISVSASAQKGGGWAFNLSFEHDALSMNSRQENYTSSIRGEFLTTQFKMPGYMLPHLKSGTLIDVSVLSLGAYGYTPQNVQSAEVEAEDRPYGSFAYGGLGVASYDLEREIVLKSELQIGMLGTGVVGDLQEVTNPVFGRPEPMGWNNQVAYANSFAFNYAVSASKASFHSGQLFLKYFLNNLHIEHDSVATEDSELIHIDTLMKDKMEMRELSELLVAETGFEFLQTNIKGGINVGMVLDNLFLTYELNLFNFNRYSLLNYIPESIKAYGPLHATHHNHGGKENFRFNVFARPTVRFVGYNAMLEGAVFNDKSVRVISHDDINRVLFEIEAGFNLLIARQVTITASWSGRSREYEGGRKFNTWGGITLGYAPRQWHN